MSQSDAIKSFILKNIAHHKADIVAITMQQFNVTRTTVHRHLTHLLKQNKIIKTGTTRQIQYFLTESQQQAFSFNIDTSLSENNIWKKYIASKLTILPLNVFDILNYGFTEMFNNAIDHSQGKKINVYYQWQENKITIKIMDDGIGVFEKICRVLHFENHKEALLHLTKGRLTTDPLNHSGEGLFFTSRVFDEFLLEANHIGFYRNNLLEDWTVQSSDVKTGTTITLIINQESARKLTDVFDTYVEQDDFQFIKTDLLVKLSQFEGESLMSRAQAKRLLKRLESFKSITLDFKDIRAVGQGFVDEVFRVFHQTNPDVKIQFIHANEDVKFMIKRGKL